MVGDMVLSLPANAAGEREPGVEFPIILCIQSDVEDVGQRRFIACCVRGGHGARLLDRAFQCVERCTSKKPVGHGLVSAGVGE